MRREAPRWQQPPPELRDFRSLAEIDATRDALVRIEAQLRSGESEA